MPLPANALAALAAELADDPLGLGLVAMSDAQAADALNLPRATIAVDRDIAEAYELLDATAPADWASLTAAEKQRYQTITGAGRVNLRNPNVRASFLAMFPPASATRTALAALQTRQGSRAEQLFGVGVGVDHLDVARARAAV
jgi:hypothetical protein